MLGVLLGPCTFRVSLYPPAPTRFLLPQTTWATAKDCVGAQTGKEKSVAGFASHFASSLAGSLLAAVVVGTAKGVLAVRVPVPHGPLRPRTARWKAKRACSL